MANLLDIVAGITYPEKEILIPTDFKTLSKIGELELEIAALGKDAEKEYEALTKEKAELVSTVQDTSWTFTLRGLPSSLVKSIFNSKRSKIKDPSVRAEEINREIIVTSIVRVVDHAQGPTEFDNDSLGKFLDAVPGDVVDKFLRTAEELSGKSLQYEYTVTDPNFS